MTQKQDITHHDYAGLHSDIKYLDFDNFLEKLRFFFPGLSLFFEKNRIFRRSQTSHAHETDTVVFGGKIPIRNPVSDPVRTLDRR